MLLKSPEFFAKCFVIAESTSLAHCMARAESGAFDIAVFKVVLGKVGQLLSDLEEPGDEDIIRKALEVISQNNGSLTREDLLKKLSEI